MREPIDIAVVGAGPCGLGVGVAARNRALSCTIFDKGCVTQSITGYPTHMTWFSSADRLELGGMPFVVTGQKPTRLESLKYYRRVVEYFDLDVRQYEAVVDVTGERGDFTVRTERADGTEAVFHARNVVVATGRFDSPNLLEVRGEELPKVTHYYTEAAPYYDQDCLVVGGSNSAVEAALDLYRAGARVTLVHFLDSIDPGVKPWVVPDITNRLENGEIAVRWRTRVAEIHTGRVVLRHEETGEREQLDNDWVFAMTGYSPDHTLLRALGGDVDPETGVPEHDPGTMQTNVPGVFVAGVLVGGWDGNSIFVENGREHGPRIARVVRASAAAPEVGAR